MTEDDDWTSYAPIGGPPEDTACSFCGTELSMDRQQGWMIGASAAICPRCVALAAKNLPAVEETDQGSE